MNGLIPLLYQSFIISHHTIPNPQNRHSQLQHNIKHSQVVFNYYLYSDIYLYYQAFTPFLKPIIHYFCYCQLLYGPSSFDNTVFIYHNLQTKGQRTISHTFFIPQYILLSINYFLMFAKIVLIFILDSLSNCARVQIKCEALLTCDSGYGYTYMDDSGNKKQSCVGSQCDTSYSQTFDIIQCDEDYFGTSCQTGRCIVGSSIEDCEDKNSCSATMDYNMTCHACTSRECDTGMCYEWGDFQYCYSKTTCDYSSIYIKVHNCPDGQDSFGNSCGCCYQVEFKDSNIGVCSSKTEFDNNNELSEYATEINLLSKYLLLSLAILFVYLIQ